MTSNSNSPGPGGFLSPILPSPPPSSHASTIQNGNTLPHTRSTPLKPASSKESAFINYVDTKLLNVSRRYEKRFNPDLEGGVDDGLADDGRGYETFGEMSKDVDAIIDVVWTSGTPSLQTPYLLNIALNISTSLSSFPFAPRPTFKILRKLDLAFCSLLRGVEVETGEQLPGFQGGRTKVSTTEKVRIRGLVEKTRIGIVETAGKGSTSVTDAGSAVQTDDDYDMTTENDETDYTTTEEVGIDNDGKWEMEVARVYEMTIVELGMALDLSADGGIG